MSIGELCGAMVKIAFGADERATGADRIRGRAGVAWHRPSATTRANVGRTRQMDMATLLWGVIFGAIGVGFFVYGKRQSAPSSPGLRDRTDGVPVFHRQRLGHGRGRCGADGDPVFHPPVTGRTRRGRGRNGSLRHEKGRLAPAFSSVRKTRDHTVSHHIQNSSHRRLKKPPSSTAFSATSGRSRDDLAVQHHLHHADLLALGDRCDERLRARPSRLELRVLAARHADQHRLGEPELHFVGGALPDFLLGDLPAASYSLCVS